LAGLGKEPRLPPNTLEASGLVRNRRAKIPLIQPAALLAGARKSCLMFRDLETVVKLQGIDLRAAELQKEIAALPKHIALIERALESHQRKLEADRALLAANQKERKQIELDVKVHEQKISKLRDQMMSAKTNEQYRAFQHEIQFCEDAIRKCEDRTLELMLESEPLEQNVKVAGEALKKERDAVEQEKAQARQRTADDQKQLDELMAERKTLAAELQPESYSAYERLRKRTAVAVSESVEGRCTACQIELRPQFYQELRKRDRMLFCENCRRILIYNPPVSFDEAGPIDAAAGTRVDMT
jgi:predicted  nucleic acid-binding Zn-ribbon protein